MSAVLLVHAAALSAQKVDLRNYVIGDYNANANEMRVAEKERFVFGKRMEVELGKRVIIWRSRRLR